MTPAHPDHPTGGHSSQAPSWLYEPCPPWCSRVHEEHDHQEDRYHQSEPSIVPVIAGTRHTVPVSAGLEGIDLVVRLGRHVGELVEWLAIEPVDRPEPRLVLTVESARSLTHHLGHQLSHRFPGHDDPW